MLCEKTLFTAIAVAAVGLGSCLSTGTRPRVTVPTGERSTDALPVAVAAIANPHTDSIRVGATAAPRELTVANAKQIIAVSANAARQVNAGGAFAVVDAGGHLLYLERLDGTFAAAAAVAAGKARTAAMFQKPTRVFEEAINKGRTSMTALPDFTPLQGGVPLVADGRVVGAIGVSGAKSAQHDEELAVLAAETFATSATACCAARAPVGHFAKAVVDAAFAKGAPLLETADFKIHASRRTAAGEAEMHALETDVIYVLEGSATFVTGGEVLGARESAPNEVRGNAIAHGDVRELAVGDVVVVPAGTPHWFKDVRGPLLYYVVKVL
jgi:glc operon protein GlcG